MSKIAEQKSLEAYPILFSERYGYDNTSKYRREAFIQGYDQGVADEREKLMAEISDIDIYHQGYDQAMQDFLEKAEKFFKSMYETMGKPNLGDKTIEQFKNYMENEM